MGRLTLSGVPTGDMFLWSSVAAFARDSGEVFVQAESGIFMINIRSRQLQKVLEASGSAIYPYATSYTPGTFVHKLTPVAAQIDGAVHFSHKTSFDSLISPDREDQAKMIFSNATTARKDSSIAFTAHLQHFAEFSEIANSHVVGSKEGYSLIPEEMNFEVAASSPAHVCLCGQSTSGYRDSSLAELKGNKMVMNPRSSL
jgi:hypothetical protein